MEGRRESSVKVSQHCSLMQRFITLQILPLSGSMSLQTHIISINTSHKVITQALSLPPA